MLFDMTATTSAVAVIADRIEYVSMRSHIARTVSACFAVLRQPRSVRRSLPRFVLQSLMSSLVLSRLDYCNATLSGIPSYLRQQLQSVLNSAARLVFSSSRYDHITPLLDPPTALAESTGEDSVQACCSRVQVFAQDGNVISRRRA